MATIGEKYRKIREDSGFRVVAPHGPTVINRYRPAPCGKADVQAGGEVFAYITHNAPACIKISLI